MSCFLLALTKFELRVFLVNNIQTSLAANYLAVRGTLLDRYSCLHIVFVLFVSEYDSALRQVIGAHFQLYLVAGEDADIV